ncbi:TPA: hypothetical protein DD425_00105 [Candidatus Saccharibacteria bacterium]|nr:hypothetical protein [Candidatus Saccharibacteria bacterium]|tara:strand:+ start:332 stop:724 length:393 start_codon:yes stop_codon:yes gene_type:complete
MSQTAEEVILGRMQQAPPPPPRFYADYVAILNSLIPNALNGLEEKAYEGGELAMVKAADDKQVKQTAVWKLTALMYLTSRGKIAIKVLDPLGELGYALAEVDINYLIEHHSSKRTVGFLQNELIKLAKTK